ncbi:MAG: Mpo1-like protein [Burkholderiales bacterium]
MRNATELLTQYAEYHRDRRNIATHLIGVPMIVFAVGVLLARPAFTIGGLALTPAWLVYACTVLWYLTRGELLVGAAVSIVVGVLVGLAHGVAQGSTSAWLAWGLGTFAVGWVIQFVGHYFEGRKPAFVDDLAGLFIGPMFVTAEVIFALGLCRPLHDEIVRRAGPTLIRERARTAA